MASGKVVGGGMTEVEQQRQAALMAVPEWLSGVEDRGTDLLVQYIIPPRLKVVQTTSKQELRQDFPPGSVVAMPMRQTIALMNYDGPNPSHGDTFHIVPLFFYPEYVEWNPLQLKQLPAIRDRSLDRKGKLAAMCRDANLRSAQCPESSDPKHQITRSEILNFVIVIVDEDHPLYMTPLVMNFARGEYMAGSNFSALIGTRTSSRAKPPMWGCVFEVHVPGEQKQNDKGQWFGLEIGNPYNHAPFIAADMAETMKGLYERYKDAYEQKTLRTDLEDVNEPTQNAAEESSF